MCDQPKFCKDCQHFEPDTFRWPKEKKLNKYKFGLCMRPIKDLTSEYLVSGVPLKRHDFASTERSKYGPCREEAIFFVKKEKTPSRFQRVVHWLTTIV